MTGSPLYDREQLQPEDTLVDEPTGDVLDSGYEPPDSVRGHGLDKSIAEQAEGETIEQRLVQEEPEDPLLPGRPLVPDATARLTGTDGVTETLVADDLPGEESEVLAEERGPVIDPTPEEDAMHIVDPDEAG